MPGTHSSSAISRPSSPASLLTEQPPQSTRVDSDHMSSICRQPTTERGRKRTQGSISTVQRDEGVRVRRLEDLQRERDRLLAAKEQALAEEVQELRQWHESRQQS